MKRLVLLLALLFGGPTDSSSSSSATLFCHLQSFSLSSHFARDRSTAPLRAALLFTFVLPFALVLAILSFLRVCLFLPLSRYTASNSIGASPIDVGWLVCHGRLATEQLTTVCHIMAQSGREPQVSNKCVRRSSGTTQERRN